MRCSPHSFKRNLDDAFQYQPEAQARETPHAAQTLAGASG